jgi:hypothetical protein
MRRKRPAQPWRDPSDDGYTQRAMMLATRTRKLVGDCQAYAVCHWDSLTSDQQVAYACGMAAWNAYLITSSWQDRQHRLQETADRMNEFADLTGLAHRTP